MATKIGPKEQRQRELREAAASRVRKAGKAGVERVKAKVVGKVQNVKASRRGARGV